MQAITLKRGADFTRDSNVILEFKRDFTCEKQDLTAATLKIYSDFRFAAYINGAFVSNAQFADCESVKTYDEIEISAFLKCGNNQIRVVILHYDKDYQIIHATPRAFCAFEITAGDKILAKSDLKTEARVSPRYKIGDKITPQLGFCFDYDFTADSCGCENIFNRFSAENCASGDCISGEGWGEVEFVQTDFEEQKRPISRCEIFSPAKSEIIAQGAFKYNGGATSGEKMQRAYLSNVSFAALSGGKNRVKGDCVLGTRGGYGENCASGENSASKNCGYGENCGVSLSFDNAREFLSGDKPDGMYVLVDLGKEICGYLSISVEVENDCVATLGWGEHLADLRPRTSVGGRSFGLALKLKKGKNTLEDRLLRFGLRYLCLFIEADGVKIERLTVCETVYPFKPIKKDFGDKLLNKIYETGVRTLLLCAHEHYEDCPWREQALYGMDSRNQMLFGYGAFEKEQSLRFARASLKLFAQCLRSDGLVELCPPSHCNLTIPSFTLYWIIAVCENADFNLDLGFIGEILPAVKLAADKFLARADERGLKVLAGAEYWNFHEWSDGLDGVFRTESSYTRELPPHYDGILTALAVIATKRLSVLLKRVGQVGDGERYAAYSERLKHALSGFYDEKLGFYCSYVTAEGQKFGYHEYTQAVVLASGAAQNLGNAVVCKLVDALKNGDPALVKMTYSAMLIKYEAIMAADKNADWCVENVAEVFGSMLFGGATSYYETELGERDFDDAGSLCHGWSAAACYVLDRYAEFCKNN